MLARSHSALLLAALAASPGWTQTPAVISAQPTPAAAPPALIVPFAIAGQPGGDALAEKACPAGASIPTENATAKELPKVVLAISEELKKRASEKGPATIAERGQQPAPPALILTGCLTAIELGGKTKRVIGMGMGTSHLAAHIRVFQLTAAGESEISEFDLDGKGANYAPPVFGGMIVNMARSKRTSVEGDGRNLADKLADKYFATPTQTASTSAVH